MVEADLELVSKTYDRVTSSGGRSRWSPAAERQLTPHSPRRAHELPTALAVIVRLLVLWGVIATAVALALLVHRRRSGDDEPPDYRVVLGFVGPAYGLLLGLLVVFAVGHYSDARHRAEDEATSLVALYDALSVYSPDTRESARHDLICYMRSIVADDWPSMHRGNTTEAPRTLAFGDRVRSDIRRLPLASARESSAYGRSVSLMTDASEARQQLLFFTE